MRETFTSGSVGRAPGNRCLYPEPDCLQPPLLRRSGFQQQVSLSVRCQGVREKLHKCILWSGATPYAMQSSPSLWR